MTIAVHHLRYYCVLVVMIVVGVEILWFDNNWIGLNNNERQWDSQSGGFNCSNVTSDRKRILFWNSFFSSADYYFGFGQRPFIDQCTPASGFSHRECETTADRRMLECSDAVVIHIRNMLFGDLPPSRKPEQVWIFYMCESPVHTNIADDKKPLLNGIFNWTMTYRRDSDVPNGYFRIIRKTNVTSTSDDAKPARRQRRLVAWLVSDCRTSSQREIYVEKLKEFIPIDIYGQCGHKCPGDSPQRCMDFVFSNYKFYLSFENSLCTDYVTEKLSNALNRGVVPIVYGGADYNAIAPPNSFINIRDFPSPKHLADYILVLNSSDQLYFNYFRWKQHYEVIPERSFCHLCKKLHTADMNNSSNHKVYDDMVTWWYDGGKCHNWL